MTTYLLPKDVKILCIPIAGGDLIEVTTKKQTLLYKEDTFEHAAPCNQHGKVDPLVDTLVRKIEADWVRHSKPLSMLNLFISQGFLIGVSFSSLIFDTEVIKKVATKTKVNKKAIIIGQGTYILIKNTTEKAVLLGRDDLNVTPQWFPRSGLTFDRFVGNKEKVTAYYKIQGWLYDKLTQAQKLVLLPLTPYDIVEGT